MDSNSEKQTNKQHFGSVNFHIERLPCAYEWFNNNSKFIEYGANNLFPQEILNLYQNASPLFTGIINKISELINGAGFDNEDSEFILNQYGKENLNVVLQKVAIDLILFNGFYLQIIWAKNGKNIASIDHVPFQKVRCAKPSIETGDIESFFVSRDWSAHRRKENAPVQYSVFNPDLSKEFPTQILQVVSYNPAVEFYASPSYSSIIKNLKIAELIGTYHLSGLARGFTPRFAILNKNGIPSPQEAQKHYDQLMAKYGNPNSNGDILLLYSDGKDTAPEITLIPEDNSDKKFKTLVEDNRTEILTAFRMPPCLVGISEAGKLGSSQEIAEQTVIVQAEIINPKQKFIEDVFNKLLSFNSKNEKVTIQKYVPDFGTNTTNVTTDSNTTA